MAVPHHDYTPLCLYHAVRCYGLAGYLESSSVVENTSTRHRWTPLKSDTALTHCTLRQGQALPGVRRLRPSVRPPLPVGCQLRRPGGFITFWVVPHPTLQT